MIMDVDDDDDMRPHARSKATDPPTTPIMIYKANKKYQNIIEKTTGSNRGNDIWDLSVGTPFENLPMFF